MQFRYFWNFCVWAEFGAVDVPPDVPPLELPPPSGLLPPEDPPDEPPPSGLLPPPDKSIEVVADQADAILATLGITRAAAGSRLVLAPDAAALMGDLALHRESAMILDKAFSKIATCAKFR